MVIVDDRAGSRDLIQPLKKAGLPVTSTRLDFGDVAFEGRGEQGAPVNIGIEYKHLPELVSSIRDGRFAGGQLPGLTGPDKMYDRSWLLVEGIYRHDDRGFLTTYKGRYRGWEPLKGSMHAVEFEKHVLTFEVCGGVTVRFTNSQADSVRYLQSLYRWWTDKNLDQHTSHLAVHTPHNIVPLSDFRQAVYRFPGVGLKVSAAVEQHFRGCLRDAVNAPAEEWAAIETKDKNGKVRRLGMKVAEGIVEFCRRRFPDGKRR